MFRSMFAAVLADLNRKDVLHNLTQVGEFPRDYSLKKVLSRGALLMERCPNGMCPDIVTWEIIRQDSSSQVLMAEQPRFVRVSHNGDYVALGLNRGKYPHDSTRIRVWAVHPVNCCSDNDPLFDQTFDRVHSIALSPSGTALCVTTYEEFFICDVTSGKKIASKNDNSLPKVTFIDDRTIAVCHLAHPTIFQLQQ